jgi:hypothetical protein
MQVDRELLSGFSEYKASALALIAANVMPLFGVIFLEWDAFAIVALYWVENVVIGAINVLKMITCSPEPAVIDGTQADTPSMTAEMQASRKQAVSELDKAKEAPHASNLFLKLAFIPFFAVHYGFFCFVHGVFVFALLGQDTFAGGPIGGLGNLPRVFSEQHLWWAVAALAASHLYSFFINYLGRGEYRRTFVPLLMAQPYARVVVLHIAILFGGFAAMALGSNVGVLAILIAGKTVLDLSLHLRERMRNANGQSKKQPGPILEELPRS